MPYVLPFIVFFALLLSADVSAFIIGEWEYPFRVSVLALVLWVFSRARYRSSRAILDWNVLLGVAVFAIWVAPDVLIPGYRDHWLFQNQVTGTLTEFHPFTDLRESALVLVFRTIRAAILVPIIEELFWRGWLLRWLISPKFEEVPLGTYTRQSMWLSAILFASEHGPYWEVGLLAGLAYNFWIVRTQESGRLYSGSRRHERALSLFVIASGRWEYWM